jgi:hypothetical protein
MSYYGRRLATGGVTRFNYVLATNSNLVMTCASDGRVNPYPNNSMGGVRIKTIRQNQVSSRGFYIQVILSRGAWPDLPGGMTCVLLEGAVKRGSTPLLGTNFM